MYVFVIVGVSVDVGQVYYACHMMVMGFKNPVRPSYSRYEGVRSILEMSLFSTYQCYFSIPKIDNLEWEGTFKPNPMRIMPLIHA